MRSRPLCNDYFLLSKFIILTFFCCFVTLYGYIQSAKLILGDNHAFDESRTSRPYKWAQDLAGIEILPEMSSFLSGKDTQNSDSASASDQRNVQTVLQRIRSQRKSKLNLV